LSTRLEIERLNIDNDYSVTLFPHNSPIDIYDGMKMPDTIRKDIISKSADFSISVSYLRGTTPTTRPVIETPMDTFLASIGELIMRSAISTKIRENLSKLKPNYLLISTNDIDVPWELMHDGLTFFSLKYSLGRSIPELENLPAERTSFVSERPRILFVADPTESLVEAKNEVVQIREALSDGSFESDLLAGKNATVQNLISFIMNQNYDIMHFACHVEFNESNPEDTSIILNDGKLTAKQMYSYMSGKSPPTLVFMNSCSSAKSSSSGRYDLTGELSSLAQGFIKAGTSLYVGTLWPIYDKDAGELAVRFYKDYINGKPVGDCLRLARSNLYEKTKNCNATWAAFVLYGDPSIAVRPPWDYKEKYKAFHELEKGSAYLPPSTCDFNLIEESVHVRQSEGEYRFRYQGINAGSGPVSSLSYILVGDSAMEIEALGVKAIDRSTKQALQCKINNINTYCKIVEVIFDKPPLQGESFDYDLLWRWFGTFTRKDEYVLCLRNHGNTVASWNFKLSLDSKPKNVNLLKIENGEKKKVENVRITVNKVEKEWIVELDKNNANGPYVLEFERQISSLIG